MEQIVNEMGKVANVLYTLPGAWLLSLFALAVGYTLRVVEAFPNRFIPVVVLLLCLIGTPIMAMGTYVADKPVTPQIMTHIFVGTIVGCVTWFFHNKVLKRIEDKIPWLKDAITEKGKE